MSLAGIRPLVPGFGRVEIRPQLADLEDLEVEAHTVKGSILFQAHGKIGARELALELPAPCTGEIVLSQKESVRFPRASGSAPAGFSRYQLPPGRSVIRLNYT